MGPFPPPIEPEPPPTTLLDNVMCEMVDICEEVTPLELKNNIYFNTQDGQDNNDDYSSLQECLTQPCPVDLKTTIMCTELDFLRKYQGDRWNDGWYDNK